MRLSKFVHLKKINAGITAIFHSISMKVFYSEIQCNVLESLFDCSNEQSVEQAFLSNGDIGLVFMKTLVSNKFLVPDDYDEYEKIDRIKDLHTEEINLKTAYFMITDDCNLRCKYCIVMNKKNDCAEKNVM